MENILKNPGLQHIMNTSLIFLEKSNIASFQLVNQDCMNIVDDPVVRFVPLVIDHNPGYKS